MRLDLLTFQIMETLGFSEDTHRIKEIQDKIISRRAKLIRDTLNQHPHEAYRFVVTIYTDPVSSDMFEGITKKKMVQMIKDAPRGIRVGSTVYPYVGNSNGTEAYGFIISNYYFEAKGYGIRKDSPKYTVINRDIILSNPSNKIRFDVIPADPRELLKYDSYPYETEGEIEIEEDLVYFLERYVKEDIQNNIPNRMNSENNKQ